MIKKEKILVAGDLHIGLNLKFRESGIYFQKATEKLAEKLREACVKSKAESIVLLGDVKESIGAPKFGEYRELGLFFESLKGMPIRIVAGNHDGGLQRVLENLKVRIRVEKEIILKDIALLHGNGWPSTLAMQRKYLIVGHTHYAIMNRGQLQKIWFVSDVSKRAGTRFYKFNEKIKLVVVPPFNELISGSALRPESRKYLPVLKNGIFNFDDARIYGIDAKLKGKACELILKND